jgi:hypothetical protein
MALAVRGSFDALARLIMESQDYPVLHFSQMAEFASALKALPAQVLEHDYSYEAFGSWSMAVRYRGVPLRVVFDGKDGHVSVQRSASRNAPYVWEAPTWEQAVGPDALRLRDLVEVVRTIAAAG